MNHASDTLTLHNGVEMPLLGLGVMHMYGSECVRAIGVSNMNIGRLEEVIAAPEIKPAVLQVELHPYFQQKALKERVASCGTVLEAWYPLGHGDAGLLNEPVFTQLAQKYGKTNAQIILRRHLQAGNIAIPGSSNEAHIAENFDIFDFELTDAEMQRIAAMDQNRRHTSY